MTPKPTTMPKLAIIFPKPDVMVLTISDMGMPSSTPATMLAINIIVPAFILKRMIPRRSTSSPTKNTTRAHKFVMSNPFFPC